MYIATYVHTDAALWLLAACVPQAIKLLFTYVTTVDSLKFWHPN